MSSKHWHAVILAGGRGTRFWPRSRASKSKQVLEIFGNGTLIQQTLERLRPVVPPERTWIITNELLRKEILKQLPDVPARQVIAEPAARNTAAPIALAARLLAAQDRNAVMGVFPADHYIEKPAAFLRLVRGAYQSASHGNMTLLGIQPRWAETGYGYLEFAPGKLQPGALQPAPLVRFREKPDADTARKFLRSGRHCWNAGMFFWRADVLLEQVRKFLPDTANALEGVPAFGSPAFSRKLKERFPLCDKISVDYGILEKASGVNAIVADDIGWNDVGSWNAVYELLPRDGDGNTARSEAIFHTTQGSFVDAPGKMVALVGVKNLVVVETGDALLIADRDQVQKVSDLVAELERLRRTDLL